MHPTPSAFEGLVVPYLQRQPWFLADMSRFDRGVWATFQLADLEILIDGRPGLASVVVTVGNRPFHVLVGWREPALAPAVLGDRQGAVLGMCDDGAGDVLCYDALADEELSTRLLAVATAGRERARRVRLVHSLVSHASLVYDERLFMKSYRVLEPAPRPEIELMLKLEEVGFEHTLRPVACWERNGWDLALVREYIPGAVEGRLLALTSLRDLLGRNLDDDRPKLDEVGGAGGDLSSEVRRLGETTGSLHLALAEAFGVRALPAGAAPRSAAIRVHGDYHLRRVFRTDAGWIVGGFGDDPLIGKLGDSTQSREPRFVSPLEDLADLSYSLRQVAAEAVAAQPAVTRVQAERLAKAWERRNRGSFLSGYLGVGGIGRLIALDRPAAAEAIKSLVTERATAT
ncbi:MAG: maltokinase N-terminal cap-like domain-containing protein [Acidimicrobiales bacterium]